ncbi:MAG: hypothetical protein IBJ00_01610 [Alphaproteobacteria bacterium]|nr:hypothetical protein [Alphaproteobacteria bacterium]
MKKLIKTTVVFAFILNCLAQEGYSTDQAEEKLFPSSSSVHANKAPLTEDSAFFNEVPNEILIQTASYLQGQDFRNFMYTSKRVAEALMNNKGFFISDNIESIADTINNTPITEFSNLVSKWERNTKKSISQLRKVYSHFEEYQEFIAKDNLEVAGNRFENCVKTLNLLYALGDKKVEKDYTNFYKLIQTILCGERVNEREDYIVHLKNFSLLVPDVRREISRNYQEGKAPFKRDPEQAALYAIDLDLPLTPKVFKK